ncbi:glycerate kinase [Corynebacterium vitaeruminis]|uniref:glycerate kinase n=1 Tax=Corynebacterium vitaeruminis TaxID=38305 RepID=UPI00055736B1|nr:glycerate kinase [Corynebacterium vitaeruminis]
MRIVIAPDSFKSTASSSTAGEYLREGARQALTELGIEAEVEVFPMADGGEGTSEIFGGQRIILPTTDAVGRLTEATYTYDPATTTAYIDVAAASGLPQVADALAPLTADTYGTGVLIADAQTRGATRIVLCLGGSATTDGGTGILVALGAHAADKAGLPLRPGGAALASIDTIDTAQLNIPAAALEWVLLTDVTNPATGENGSAAVFGPQKGATPEQVEALDRGIAALCEALGVDPTTPGMGAAGAIPVGITWLSTVLHGTPEHVHILPGAPVVADSTGLTQALEGADLLITGEGAFDSQSLQGKVVGTLLGMAGQTPVTIVAGRSDSPAPEGAEVLVLKESTSVREQLVDAGRRAILHRYGS